jgi:hypothetical protein
MQGFLSGAAGWDGLEGRLHLPEERRRPITLYHTFKVRVNYPKWPYVALVWWNLEVPGRLNQRRRSPS